MCTDELIRCCILSFFNLPSAMHPLIVYSYNNAPLKTEMELINNPKLCQYCCNRVNRRESFGKVKNYNLFKISP